MPPQLTVGDGRLAPCTTVSATVGAHACNVPCQDTLFSAQFSNLLAGCRLSSEAQLAKSGESFGEILGTSFKEKLMDIPKA